ncbi:uncharacterized protein [Salminus brasiliensis]|uniref:uncharacterized protein isoform X2 n=1 Tax=Salminus brasiliensis TaxID=930266 RepID=UPI003B839DCE
MGKCRNPTLDAKQHICARRDKSIVESRFINVVKGNGVFATALIPEGSFIVEYRGTLMEAGQVAPDPYAYYFLHNNTRYCIDASVDDGSLGRLVNDDSDPNSKMKIISVSQVPHLGLFALRNIQPGEEITYDYGGYDLPWRRGTWLCTGSPAQSENDKEMVCEEQKQACGEESAGKTEDIVEEEQMMIEDIPCDPQTTEQLRSECEQKTCENQPSHIQTSQQTCESGQLKSNDDSPPVSNQRTDEGGQTVCKHEPSQVQTAVQVTPEEQMECEEQAFSSQSAEQDSVEKQMMTEDIPRDAQSTEQSSQVDQNSSRNSSDVDDNDPVSSDEEFIPDSETSSDDDDDDDSDGDKPVSKPSKKVEEKMIMPPVHNHLVTQPTKKNFCFVCGKSSSKIARHLKVHRQENSEIAKAFKLKKSSKERKHVLEVLRNRGNYQHNIQVLNKGTGLIKVRRMPSGQVNLKDKIDTQKYEYCMHCKGLYMRKELWQHSRRCTSNPDRAMRKGTKSRVLGLAAIAHYPHLQHISEDVKKVLTEMHQDEVAQVVRNDEYVLRLAQDFFDKKGKGKEKHIFVRQTVRCIGKFLITLHKTSSLRNLAEAIKPSSFPKVIEAVKEIAEFNKETNSFAIPSLARTVGMTLRKFCILIADKAFAVNDKRLIESTAVFLKLFSEARSQFALRDKKRQNSVANKPALLTFVHDVTVLHCYLEKAAQSAMKELREAPTAQSYADLSKVMLAQILMFNRRHGEASQLTIKDFQQRDKMQFSEDELTEFERICERHCKIEVEQEVGGRVMIILTSDMISALMLLIEKRGQCGVCDSNPFVFGQPKGGKYYRGENALRICAKESGAINPEHLASTEFSRHIATLTQVLSLKNQELGKLAKFIGHDISVRKEYYRKPEATARLARICKLILAIEKGSASHVLQESLDDIFIPVEVNESDSEDDFEEEMMIFEKRRAAQYKELNTWKKRNTRSKTVY